MTRITDRIAKTAENRPSKMQVNAIIRKVVTAVLMLTTVLWAEAGLALVAGDQVMQCSMTMQQMQAMGATTCCPDDDVRVPALSEERRQCCSVSSDTERPLGFLVSSERVTSHLQDVVASLPMELAAPAAQHFAVCRSADAPRFVKPVLELKTDLRI